MYIYIYSIYLEKMDDNCSCLCFNEVICGNFLCQLMHIYLISMAMQHYGHTIINITSLLRNSNFLFFLL